MTSRSPIWKTYDEVGSTQAVAGELLLSGEEFGVVFSRHQTEGKGRFDRKWFSAPNEVLAMSIVFDEHPRPYLIGMGCALAVASTLDCHVQWPNDLVIGDKKVAGVLTEIKSDRMARRFPVVGIGVNLNQRAFPAEIAHRATSLALRDEEDRDPLALAKAIVGRIESMKTPNRWQDIQSEWMARDSTEGKHYRLNDGRTGTAIRVGDEGELICLVDGAPVSVYAADALFGLSE